MASYGVVSFSFSFLFFPQEFRSIVWQALQLMKGCALLMWNFFFSFFFFLFFFEQLGALRPDPRMTLYPNYKIRLFARS